jgi:hypothetical protein
MNYCFLFFVLICNLTHIVTDCFVCVHYRRQYLKILIFPLSLYLIAVLVIIFIRGRMNVALVPSSLSLFAFVSDQVSSQHYNISLGGRLIFFRDSVFKIIIIIIIISPVWCSVFMYLYFFCAVLVFLCWLYN